jgi:protein-disulfide isomerase
MQRYKAALARLRKAATIEVTLAPPTVARVAVSDLGPTRGLKDAKVTIVEFSDFQCPYCRASQEPLKKITAEYPNDVKLVFRHLPLRRSSIISAISAFCAEKQDHFWEFHDAIFAAKNMSATLLREIAADTKLDLKKFDECVSSAEPLNAVNADFAEAKRLGIEGTPTFIVNGRVFKGMPEFSVLKAVIERELGLQPSGPGH